MPLSTSSRSILAGYSSPFMRRSRYICLVFMLVHIVSNQIILAAQTGGTTSPTPPSIQAINDKVREVLDAAVHRKYLTLVKSSNEWATRTGQIRNDNPRILWEQLVQEQTQSLASAIQSGSLCCNGLSKLARYTEFEHRILDIETRISARPSSRGYWPTESFITIEYLDARNSPMVGGGDFNANVHIFQRVMLNIRFNGWDQRILEVREVQRGFQTWPNVPLTITGVAWDYHRTTQVSAKIIGAHWPLAATLRCGTAGSVSLPSIPLPRDAIGNPSPPIFYVALDGLYNAAASCILSVRDTDGHSDRRLPPAGHSVN